MNFARIRDILRGLPSADAAAREEAQRRQLRLTKPQGALGRLEDIAVWAASWQGHPLRAAPVQALVFAGTHGVTAKGVSAYPSEVTVQMVENFRRGGAAVNQLCQVAGAELSVHALDLERPTLDFTEQPAMSEEDCAAHFVFGMNCVHPDAAVLCVGEMGIGNTTSAAALSCALFGGDSAEWTGRGTGVDDAGLTEKAEVVRTAVALHVSPGRDALELLSRLGGRELAAIAGAVAQARLKRVPVLLDGYVATAAAAVLARLAPGALDHCLAAHRSAEMPHRRLLDELGLVPLLDLGMRLGEASGAVLAANIVRSAIETHNGMATFAEAGVSGRTEDET